LLLQPLPQSRKVVCLSTYRGARKDLEVILGVSRHRQVALAHLHADHALLQTGSRACADRRLASSCLVVLSTYACGAYGACGAEEGRLDWMVGWAHSSPA
jgi:hypothetical protein